MNEYFKYMKRTDDLLFASRTRVAIVKNKILTLIKNLDGYDVSKIGGFGIGFH